MNATRPANGSDRAGHHTPSGTAQSGAISEFIFHHLKARPEELGLSRISAPLGIRGASVTDTPKGALWWLGLPQWLSGEQFRRCRRRRCDPWVGKTPWRREWQPTAVLLPGESHGQRILMGYSPRGHRESDMTERLKLTNL